MRPSFLFRRLAPLATTPQVRFMRLRRHTHQRFNRIRWWRWLVLAFVAGFVALLVPVGMACVRGQRDVLSELARAPAGRITSRAVTTPGSYELHEIEHEDPVGAVLATLRVPRHRTRPVAAMVIVGGLRTGRRAAGLVDADLPCAVLAMDYAGSVPRRAGLADIVRIPELQRDLTRTAVALRDLVQHLRRDPRIDAERVFIVGASLGAPLASAVAATVQPAGLVLLHGFADHAALVAHRLESEVGSRTLRSFLGRVTALLTARFDVRRTLPRLHDVPVLVIEAQDDELIPRACRVALWDATPEPRDKVHVPGGHMRPTRDSDALAAAMNHTRAWVATRGVPELAL